MPYLKVKQLPGYLQQALIHSGYAKADIQVLVKEKESVYFGGGDGYRGFATLVNLSTGAFQSLTGSWGGANPFNPNNAVDLNDQFYTLTPEQALIRGFTGGSSGATHCTITLSPKNAIVSGLLEQAALVSEEEAQFLAIFRAYKPAYRKPYLIGKEEKIKEFVARGFLSQNKAGAIALTTLGKNVCENVRVF